MFSFNTEYLFSVDNVTLSIERNHIVKLKIDSNGVEINVNDGDNKAAIKINENGLKIE